MCRIIAQQFQTNVMIQLITVSTCTPVSPPSFGSYISNLSTFFFLYKNLEISPHSHLLSSLVFSHLDLFSPGAFRTWIFSHLGIFWPDIFGMVLLRPIALSSLFFILFKESSIRVDVKSPWYCVVIKSTPFPRIHFYHLTLTVYSLNFMKHWVQVHVKLICFVSRFAFINK